MHYRAYWKPAAVLILLGFVSACSSVGKTIVTKEMAQPIPAGKSVAVSVKSTIREVKPVHERIVLSIHQELSRKLRADKKFRSVVDAPMPADYAIDIKIVKVNIISPATRVMLGMGGWRSSIKVNVEVRNKAPDQLMGSFEVIGSGARNFMSAQGYGADDPVRKIVEQVMAKLG